MKKSVLRTIRKYKKKALSKIKDIYNWITELKFVTIMLIILGLFFTGYEIISQATIIDKTAFRYENISGSGRKIIESIGIAFFTMGVVNVLFETKDLVSYFIKILTYVLVSDGYLDYIKPKRMEEMVKKIEEKLYLSDKKITADNYFYSVQNNLRKLLDSYYYQECHISVNCFVDHNKGKFIKKTRKRVVVINPYKDAGEMKIEIPFCAEMQKVERENIDNIYKVNFFRIYDNDYTSDFTSEINKMIKRSDTSDKIYSVKFEAIFKYSFSEKCIIDMEIETITPISDIYFTNILTVPCKDYRIEYRINNDDDYVFNGFVFAFTPEKNNKTFIHPIDRGIEINYTDWLMPGEGALISFL